MKRLCYGSMATLVLQCLVDGITQKFLHQSLMRSLTNNFNIDITDNSQSSRFFTCVRPVVDKEVIISTPLVTTAMNFGNLVTPLIDPNKRRELVAFIIDVIMEDEGIEADTVVDVVTGTTKEQLGDCDTFSFSDFLAGVFYYAAIVPDNTVGKDFVKEIDGNSIGVYEDAATRIVLHDSAIKNEEIAVVGRQVEIVPIAQSNDLDLLAEVSRHCPLCDNPLLLEKNGKCIPNYRLTYIYPQSISLNKSKELSQVAFTHNEIESIQNQIMLCPSCHANYQHDTTLDDYQQLLGIKSSLLRDLEIRDKASQYHLDELIVTVIERISKIPQQSIVQPRYEVVEVAQKIKKGNILLERKVHNYISEYYPDVKDAFALLEDEKQRRFKKIAATIRCSYLEFAGSGSLFEQPSQGHIYESLVEWLMHTTHTNERIPCEILIAFFIQCCEVFDEIT